MRKTRATPGYGNRQAKFTSGRLPDRPEIGTGADPRTFAGKAALLLPLLFAAGIAGSAQAGSGPESSWIPKTAATQGWVQIAPTAGGIYAYGAPPNAAPRGIQRLLISRVVRQDFDRLSAQQEEALWNYRQSLLDAQRAEASPAINVVPARRHSRRPHGGLATASKADSVLWPRYVIVDGKTCVPRVEFAKADDWKNHLICWADGHVE